MQEVGETGRGLLYKCNLFSGPDHYKQRYWSVYFVAAEIILIFYYLLLSFWKQYQKVVLVFIILI